MGHHTLQDQLSISCLSGSNPILANGSGIVLLVYALSTAQLVSITVSLGLHLSMSAICSPAGAGLTYEKATHRFYLIPL